MGKTFNLLCHCKQQSVLFICGHAKNNKTKSNKIWPLICRANCQPIGGKTRYNLNLSSNNVETDVVIVWTLADMPEQGNRGRRGDVRLQSLLSSAS